MSSPALFSNKFEIRRFDGGYVRIQFRECVNGPDDPDEDRVAVVLLKSDAEGLRDLLIQMLKEH